MAATSIIPAKSGSRVMSKILQRLARGSSQTTIANQKSNMNISRLKRRCWYVPTADPTCGQASGAVLPIQLGEFVYTVDTDEAFICSVAPVSGVTSAVFIQLHV